MAAAAKQKEFQWNKSDKMENPFNFKAQMEYENIETRLNSMRLPGKHKLASLSASNEDRRHGNSEIQTLYEGQQSLYKMAE